MKEFMEGVLEGWRSQMVREVPQLVDDHKAQLFRHVAEGSISPLGALVLGSIFDGLKEGICSGLKR